MTPRRVLWVGLVAIGCVVLTAGPGWSESRDRLQPSRATATKRPPSVPSETELRKLVKVTLITFNDAVQTRDFSVLHSKTSVAFRKSYSPKRLRGIFWNFIVRKVDISPIVNLEPRWDDPPVINADGRLQLQGHFETTPSVVKFEFLYTYEGGEWRLTHINVDVAPPPSQ